MPTETPVVHVDDEHVVPVIHVDGVAIDTRNAHKEWLALVDRAEAAFLAAGGVQWT